MSTPIEPPGPRKIRWATIGAFVVGAVTIIGTLTQTWTLLFPAGAAPQSPQPAAGTSPIAVSAAPAATTHAPAPVQGGTYLDTLPAVTGSSLLVPLPKDLAGLPEYAHALAVKCPPNTTGNTMAEVAYVIPRNLTTFTATLTAHQTSVPTNQLVQLSVFPAPKDLLPNGGNEGKPAIVQAEIGAKTTVRADLTDAFHVRLRIQCNLPGAVAVIVDPMLRP
ncbi:hypothetical protein AB0B66_23105 [Catellatospora sp. NPDC049111]|uniref:hypothetical protein n=1 Tax=Catellatospora sp. NPDC049111 TaxID=3155271 RepID=UPI0033D510AD